MIAVASNQYIGGVLMLVLVGCECSSTVTAAFRRLGVEAFSCDLAPCYGDLPEYHFQGDLRDIYYKLNPDLLIAHPPCTYLSRAGLGCLLSGGFDWLRWEQGLLARDFFLWCLSRPCLVCVENPVPIKRYQLPKPSQVVQPWFFGDPYTKQTCLWLRGLPPLEMTDPVKPFASWTCIHKSPRIRSKTFPGLASAMASAWSGDLIGLQYMLPGLDS